MLRFLKNLCFKTQTNKPIFIRKDYQNNPSKLNNNEDLVVTYNNVSKATYYQKPNQNLVIPNQCIVDAANIASCITNPLLPFILKHLTDYCFKSLNIANNNNAFNSVNDNIDIDIDIDNNNNINNDINRRYLSYYKYLNLNFADRPPVIDNKFNNYTPKFSFNNDKITIPENLSQYIAYRIYFKFYKNLWLVKDDNNIGQYFLQFKTENCTIDFKDILKTITLYDLVPFVIETILDKINSTNVIIILHKCSNINDKHINDDCVFTYCECLKKLNSNNNFNTVKPSCNHSLRVHFNFGNFYKNIENIQNININKIQIMRSSFIDDDFTIIEHSNFFAFVDNENNNSDHTNIKCYRPNPAPPIENDHTKTFNKYLYGHPVLSNLYEYGVLTNKLATHIPLSPLCPIIISNDNYNNQPEPENCKNINKINICKYDIQFDKKKKTLHIKPIINNLIHLVMKLYNNYMQHFYFLSQFYFCSYINSSNVVNDQLYYVDPSKSDQTHPPLLPQSKPPAIPQQFQNNRHNNNRNPSAPQHPAPIYNNNNRNRSHSPKLKYMKNFRNNQYDNVYLEPINQSSINSSPPAYTHIDQNNIYDEINQQNDIDIEEFTQSSHLLPNNRNSRYNKRKPFTRNSIPINNSNND